ncbi:MAG: cytochrome c [Acidimicrobiales bacterium]|nr:cytochrome c [Acidimicrobiales bacterium]
MIPRRSILLSVVIVVGGLVASVGCSSGPSRPSDPVLAQGYDIYRTRCQACHGANGEGQSAPGFKGIADRLSFEKHVEKVVDGVDGTRMPAWKGILTDDEINAVVRYEREVLGAKN